MFRTRHGARLMHVESVDAVQSFAPTGGDPRVEARGLCARMLLPVTSWLTLSATSPATLSSCMSPGVSWNTKTKVFASRVCLLFKPRGGSSKDGGAEKT